ncbi:MAG: RHS repeat-associated core domain-containing protein [Chloroflexi bacterium]|nr:RHS repeat-associated core domain-containing protein [Ardenticatenaceae bacterium]MBL1131461.1 RHS repeat-associated core domain-containing protein [Chloroflexota bacterium]NOG37571.1 RHS repeat-associated core domain-containing protein [Chloroflexota bacterium]
MSGQLNSAGDGRLFVQYSNGTIHDVWQNEDVFNGSQNITGNFTTPANVFSFQVGTEVVLDNGNLAFDDLTLTAYSDHIIAVPLTDYRLTAQITGELNVDQGQGGKVWAVYENLAGQPLGRTLLWSNPANFSGTAVRQAVFTPVPLTDKIRIALETNLDAGYLTFDNLELENLPATGPIIQRSTYSLAGQPIAVKVAGDPAPGNNGIFFTYSDHLGSTNVMSYGYNLNGSPHPQAGQPVPYSEARYLPFGGWRGAAPTAGLTDRGFTGHKHNNLGSGAENLGLIYMNARYYSPYINRFISADSIVPDPANPQSYNRYSYVLNRPINFIDPTGHATCEDMPWECNDDGEWLDDGTPTPTPSVPPPTQLLPPYVPSTKFSSWPIDPSAPGYSATIQGFGDNNWTLAKLSQNHKN